MSGNAIAQGVRAVGVFHIWTTLLGNALVVLVCGAIAVYMLFYYRHGWKRGSFVVRKIDRSSQTNGTRCTTAHNAQTCVDVQMTRCTLHFSEIPPLTTTYKTQNVPRVGQTVTVYFDPKHPKRASTKSLDKGLIATVCIVIALIVVAGSVLLYRFRHNEAVQTFSGASAVMDLVTS